MALWAAHNTGVAYRAGVLPTQVLGLIQNLVQVQVGAGLFGAVTIPIHHNALVYAVRPGEGSVIVFFLAAAGQESGGEYEHGQAFHKTIARPECGTPEKLAK